MALVSGNWVTHRRFSGPLQHAFGGLEARGELELRRAGILFSDTVPKVPDYNPLATEEYLHLDTPIRMTGRGFTTVDDFDDRMTKNMLEVVAMVGETFARLLVEIMERPEVFVSQKPTITFSQRLDEKANEQGFQGRASVAFCQAWPEWSRNFARS